MVELGMKEFAESVVVRLTGAHESIALICAEITDVEPAVKLIAIEPDKDLRITNTLAALGIERFPQEVPRAATAVVILLNF
jgi:hypothetical protein